MRVGVGMEVGMGEGWGDESLGQQMYYGHGLCEDCLDSDPDELMMADKADPGIKKGRAPENSDL